jgi:hypothetical protein
MDSATAQTGGSALISRETRGLRGNGTVMIFLLLFAICSRTGD